MIYECSFLRGKVDCGCNWYSLPSCNLVIYTKARIWHFFSCFICHRHSRWYNYLSKFILSYLKTKTICLQGLAQELVRYKIIAENTSRTSTFLKMSNLDLCCYPCYLHWHIQVYAVLSTLYLTFNCLLIPRYL